jgi:L-lactate dehydrogenase complex protein LldG
VERSQFLSLVRERLAGVEDAPLPTRFPPTPASGDGRLFQRFAEELSAAGGEAQRIPAWRLPDAVAGIAGGARTAVVSGDLGAYRGPVEAGLSGTGCGVAPPSRDMAAGADLGITGALLGVASTGSILVAAAPGAPRVASLLPPVHLAVLPEKHILPGFEELFDVLPGHLASSSQALLITGPSRTADIELSLVRGVHGPGRTTILVIEP